MIRYHLDDLGWFQFESLIQLLVKREFSAAIQAWGGHGDNGRDAFYRGRLGFPNKGTLSDGPFLFQVKFVEEANAAGAKPAPPLINAIRKEVEQIQKRLDAGGKLSADWSAIRHYVLYTNAPLSPDLRSQIEELLRAVLPSCSIHPMGGEDVCALIDNHPTSKRAFPQLLSLRDFDVLLEEVVHKDVLERSRAAIEEARGLLPVFVPTTAYEEAFRIVRHHHFLVLEGPPEMGKTAIARMLSIVQLLSGWEVIECRKPDDFYSTYKRDNRQVFIADDAFGRTEYKPEQVFAWEADLSKILSRLDRTHWFLWTSRKHILERARRNLDAQGIAENFPEPAEIIVEASDLTKDEKALILYQHARGAKLSQGLKDILRENALLIVHQEAFTPERIRRFIKSDMQSLASIPSDDPSRDQRISQLVYQAIQNPTKGMRLSYESLAAPQKWLLISLLEGPPFICTKEDLQGIYRKYLSDTAIEPFDRLVDELNGAFLQMRILGYGSEEEQTWIDWVHPSYRDLVIDELSKDKSSKLKFLKTASLAGINLAVSDSGGPTGTRKFPLMNDMDDWRIFSERCLELARQAHEQESTELLDVLNSAHGEASDEKRHHLATVIGRVCAIFKRLWDENDPVGVDALKSYCRVSLAAEELPPMPSFTKIWASTLASLTRLLDSGESCVFAHPDVLTTWLDLIKLVKESEPRFLARAEFPEAYIALFENIFDHVEKQLRADVEEDRFRELAREEGLVAQRLQDLAEISGYKPERARNLIVQVATHSQLLQEKADELGREEEERDEDDDYDRWREAADEASDLEIQERFSDL